MKKIALIENPVRTYAWGSRSFIPDLMGKSSPAEEPIAELWMGAHPISSSMVLVEKERLSLLELIRKRPIDILGEPVAKRYFNNLPFLFKVLAAAKPLSIQAHPNRDQAREGYARENSQKIPLKASHRNYKDENHKPEIICALEPFWALKGFRHAEEIISLLDHMGLSSLEVEQNELRKNSDQKGLRAFFSALMVMEKPRRAQVLMEAVQQCKKVAHDNPTFEWVVRLSADYPNDIGILSPIFLNLVQLNKGEALNIHAGELHAYLEGAGIELMANSDNVLRGGLTPKHVDVQKLMKILTFQTGKIKVLKPDRGAQGELTFSTQAAEYSLSQLGLQEGDAFKSSKKRSVEIMICIDGKARIIDLAQGDVLSLRRGSSFIVPAAVEQYRIEGTATIYKASVPLKSSNP